MKSVGATAPGKVIVVGEHAVVYGQPAIAIPLDGVYAKATIRRARKGSGLSITARNLGRSFWLRRDAGQPLVVAAQLALKKLGETEPDATVEIRSTIPLASGLGSGAAVSAALIRSLAGYVGKPISTRDLSDLVYEVEKIYHGNPSGIDNSVICYNQPVFFIRGRQPQTFSTHLDAWMLVADTGIASPTKLAVSHVRQLWEGAPTVFDEIFHEVGRIAKAARRALAMNDGFALGLLLNENHELLRRLEVSSPELDALVDLARRKGALGAKLSGGGLGGNMIALVSASNLKRVSAALSNAGAVRVIKSSLSQGR